MNVFETPIEVRYAETDQMGVVYHANYLIWFEVGRTKLVEQLGLSYADMEEQGYLAPVLEAHVTFKRPVTYGETALVRTWVKEYNGLRTVYGYEIRNQNQEVCVEGHTSHVIVRKGTFQPVSMRRVFPEWHNIYENVRNETAPM